MLDFTLGKDVALGSMGTGTLGAGVRIAQFTERTKLDIGADPNYNIYLTPFSKYHDIYRVHLRRAAQLPRHRSGSHLGCKPGSMGR